MSSSHFSSDFLYHLRTPTAYKEEKTFFTVKYENKRAKKSQYQSHFLVFLLSRSVFSPAAATDDDECEGRVPSTDLLSSPFLILSSFLFLSLLCLCSICCPLHNKKTKNKKYIYYKRLFH